MFLLRQVSMLNCVCECVCAFVFFFFWESSAPAGFYWDENCWTCFFIWDLCENRLRGSDSRLMKEEEEWTWLSVHLCVRKCVPVTFQNPIFVPFTKLTLNHVLWPYDHYNSDGKRSEYIKITECQVIWKYISPEFWLSGHTHATRKTNLVVLGDNSPKVCWTDHP